MGKLQSFIDNKKMIILYKLLCTPERELRLLAAEIEINGRVHNTLEKTRGLFLRAMM